MASTRWGSGLIFCAVLGGLGCLDSAATRCGDLYCPAGTVCAPTLEQCVTLSQLSACDGREEDAPCSLSGEPLAFCLAQVCTAVRCGDGLLMHGEACDDGNTHSCDGCSADCRSEERCGNGLVECDEQCDEGSLNSWAPNAGCRPDCRRQRCGDGIVDDRSGEDCDGAPPAQANCQSMGYYQGELQCSVACRADVSTCSGSCGDGEVSEAELCDGLPPTGETCLDFGYDLGNLSCTALCTPQFEQCQRMGFRPSTFTSTRGYFLNDIWAAASDAVFAGGYNGLVLHYDGQVWSTLETGASETIYRFGGTSAHDVYAVGRWGHIMHFDGVHWQVQDAGVSVHLNGVWAAATDDVYVAGDEGTLLHSRGDGVWEHLPQPLPPSDRLFSVWGTSSSDVFVAAEGAVLHFDGHSWAAMTVPEVVRDGRVILNAIWGASSTDVYAVGERGTVLHFDGSDWVQLPALTSNVLTDVVGGGANNVYVSGEGGVVLHYSGQSWSLIPTGTTQTIGGVTVWGDGVRAAGTATLIEFFPGTPTLSTVQTGMNGDVTAMWSPELGLPLFVSSVEGEIFRFDGVRWEDTHSGTNTRLWALWGVSPSDLFAAGDDGLILHYDGAQWSPMVTPDNTTVYNWFWGTARDNLYAVGTGGTLIHFDGSTWIRIETGVDIFFFGIWGSGPNDIFAVGEAGVVIHFDGNAWSRIDTGTEFEFWGVWGTGPHDVYLFSDVDGVLHYDGHSFRQTSISSRLSINYGMGRNPNDMLAIEYEGQGLFHYNGIDWTTLRAPPLANFSLWVRHDKSYLGARGGNLVIFDRNCAQTENDCSDRWDNDCDGALNCADPDCLHDERCQQGGYCATPLNLSCQSSTAGNTLGGAPIIERYGCDTRHENGRERVYRFVSPGGGPVSLELTSSVGELDVIVLGTFASGGCDAAGTCLGATGASAPRQVTFQAEPGRSYYVIVDGAEKAAGPYQLQVSCP